MLYGLLIMVLLRNNELHAKFPLYGAYQDASNYCNSGTYENMLRKQRNVSRSEFETPSLTSQIIIYVL